ncbi:Ser/Thr protein kinase RdoA (MazF antagonist) [Paenibacillus turicensis]|uniref:Ser/Thr protein kinase RdoA (MazF antagonist) n=1 Tax=Paenibacillus turicensis TaxID=160487 RepID=A0ABS4FRW4_9BACL|nr:Ser/Thr protein kinase RdoA (MazF antagonist) [Paenibacillus turicensis]
MFFLDKKEVNSFWVYHFHPALSILNVMRVNGGITVVDGFENMDTLTKREQLIKLADKLIVKVLQKYKLDGALVQFIQFSETITYKVQTLAGQAYLLRFHLESTKEEEIEAELHILRVLGELNNPAHLVVPQGLRNEEGHLATHLHTDEGWSPLVTMMYWVEGEPLPQEQSDRLIFKMGEWLATVHEAMKKIEVVVEADTLLARPTWGIISFRQAMEKLGQYYKHFLTVGEWSQYQTVGEKIISCLEQLENMNLHSNSDSFGLIHGDVHLGNYIVHGDQPYLIDFARCGYGYYLYDVAGVMLGLSPEQRKVYIEGYEKGCSLPANYVSHIECFFVMHIIENGAHHCSNPNEIQGMLDQQPYALAYINSFLEGKSFLYQSIPPVQIEEKS